MKREILFKAKRVDNGEWVYGNLYIPNQMLRGVYISLDTTCVNMIPDLDEEEEITKEQIDNHDGIMIGKFIEVHPDTVCQFTGLLDKNGNKIFEDDKIHSESHKPSDMVVKFIEGGFCMVWDGYFIPIDINHFYTSNGCQFEITGNIFDK